jgi:hypothetical protein
MACLIKKPIPSSFWYLSGVPLVLSFATILSILGWICKKSYNFSILLNYEVAVVIFFLFYPIVIMIFPNAIFYAVFSNFMLLILTICVIFLGYHYENASLVNSGFIFFGIHFLTRYIDFGYKYLPRSLFFILAGVILILAATFMEKQRRKLVSAIRHTK